MEIVITAVGPDHKGLADPIVHHVTQIGANISEIQMFDHREEHVFAMMLRMHYDFESPVAPSLVDLRRVMHKIGEFKGLSIRVWSPEERGARPNLAICVTYRPEPALALLQAIDKGELNANPAVMIGNRENCAGLANQFGIDWHRVGDDQGNANDERMVELFRPVRSRLCGAGTLHADPSSGKLLEICWRSDRQSTPWLVARISRHQALS